MTTGLMRELDLVRVLASTHPILYWELIRLGSPSTPQQLRQVAAEDIRTWLSMASVERCWACGEPVLRGPAGGEPLSWPPEVHRCLENA